MQSLKDQILLLIEKRDAILAQYEQLVQAKAKLRASHSTQIEAVSETVRVPEIQQREGLNLQVLDKNTKLKLSSQVITQALQEIFLL